MKIKYKPWAKGLMYLVEAVVIILSVFPILWVIMSSFKTNGEILSSPLALPAHFSLDTFIDIFQKYSFPTYFFTIWTSYFIKINVIRVTIFFWII